MKKIRRSRWVGAWVLAGLAALGFAVSPIPAQAIVIIDFGTGTAGAGGTLTDLGGGNFSGVGIPVDVLSVSGAPANNGVYDLSGTFLSGTSVGGNSAVLDFNTLLNAISITGDVAALGVPQSTLLSGTISSYNITDPSGPGWSIDAAGPDVKNATLLTALGLAPGTPFQYFGFSISGNFNGTTGTAVSTDIINTAPEPGTLLLVGMGLVGLGYLGRRKNA